MGAWPAALKCALIKQDYTGTEFINSNNVCIKQKFFQGITKNDINDQQEQIDWQDRQLMYVWTNPCNIIDSLPKHLITLLVACLSFMNSIVQWMQYTVPVYYVTSLSSTS